MQSTMVDGVRVAHELIGDSGPPWVITPGGRFSKDYGGVRELAEAIAAHGHRVLIWDRPNTGASDVCFDGASESAMQADTLAGLLRALDLAPAIVLGGSGGSRVSLLTAGRHPEVVRALALWWISGGALGLVALGYHYCSESIRAAWTEGMEAVVELPEWQEVLTRNPANRERMLALEPQEFIDTMERWLLTYCPCEDQLVPGLTDAEAARVTMPTLVLRSGSVDLNHPRATSERIAATLADATLAEPPWGDNEWPQRQAARARGESLFARWPMLAPMLVEWADGLGTAQAVD